LTDPAVAATLREHLEHYHIREQLELQDISRTIDAVLVAGPGAREAMTALGVASLPEAAASHVTCRLGDLEARVVRIMGQGADGYQLQVAAGMGTAVAERLMAVGIARGDLAALEALRIESAYPAAADIPPKTLPQELGRDARAISFTKGCYLGQETVARLDALGHVNRRLTLVAIDAPAPPPVPTPILRDGAEAGLVTSACLSPRVGGAVGLGIVAVKMLAAGGLTVAGASARPIEQGALG
ncbi:MAG: YgfZ/GcvT domain-containing protein, partial [Planctomycetota bacterium]